MFSYVFHVAGDRGAPIQGRVWDAGGVHAPLLGRAPVLHWTDDSPEPWKLYARITLRPSLADDSAAAGIAFTIDRGMTTMLRPGDQLHVAALPLIGLSIVRDGLLAAAAGPAETLIQLPLGEITIRFASQDMAWEGPHVQPGGSYRLLPWGHPEADRPIEIVFSGQSEVFWWGRPEIGPFEALITATRKPSGPIVSLERRRTCPETAAHTSAQLLDRHGYQLIGTA